MSRIILRGKKLDKKELDIKELDKTKTKHEIKNSKMG